MDRLCLLAIVVARLLAQKPQTAEGLDAWKKRWDRIKREDVLSQEQRKQALELVELAGCDPTVACETIEWRKYQDALYPHYFKFKPILLT